MPSSSIHVLTLRPISSYLLQQSVAFSPSDNFSLLFGGIRYSDRYTTAPCPVRTADFHFNHQSINPDHATILFSSGSPFIHHHRRENPIRVNGHILAEDGRAELQDGDSVELGHPDEYDGTFRIDLDFKVFLTDPSAMARRNRQILAPGALIPLSPDVLADLVDTQDAYFRDQRRAWHLVERGLQSELAETRKQLQPALEATATHTCSPPIPPRPYRQLIEDLRSPPVDPSPLDQPDVPLSPPMPPLLAPDSSRPASRTTTSSLPTTTSLSLPSTSSSHITTPPPTSISSRAGLRSKSAEFYSASAE
ncbi:hypothetical protein CF319_g8916 [Tilletia indica]|nr:hypothetical protein CF319_g8916 [Tilletia indica]